MRHAKRLIAAGHIAATTAACSDPYDGYPSTAHSGYHPGSYYRSGCDAPYYANRYYRSGHAYQSQYHHYGNLYRYRYP